MKFLPFIALATVAAASFMASCERKLEDAQVEIVDPKRHYYPVLQGELLGVTYEIENTGKTPLFIREIQTTCGCLVVNDELPIVILPNKTGSVHLTYNSLKNVGYVEHFAWLYGNFADSTYREIQFDTNVVPPTDYTRDYEERFRDYEMRSPTLKDLVDGKTTEKGYYTDQGIDPRQENLDEMNNYVDGIIGR